MSDSNGVIISQREVYQEVQEVKKSLVEIQGMLKETMVVMEQRHGRIEERVDLHDEQISTLRAKSEAHAHAVTLLEAEKKLRDKRDARRPTWWGVVAAGGGIAAFLTIAQQALNSIFPAP